MLSGPVGILGYLAFGATTKSAIIYNLPSQDIASIVVKFFFILNIIGSYIVISNPVFNAIESFDWYRKLAGLDEDDELDAAALALKKAGSSMPAKNLEDDASPLKPDKPGESNEGGRQKPDPDRVDAGACTYAGEKPMTWCSGFQYFITRTLVVVIVCVVAAVVPNLNLLLVFAGSIFGVLMNFILPVMFYNRAYSMEPKNKKLLGK